MGAPTLEKMGVNVVRFIFILSAIFIWAGCASKILKYSKSEELKKNQEFEQQVKIVEVPPPAETATNATGSSSVTSTTLVGPTTTTVPQVSHKNPAAKATQKTSKKKTAKKAEQTTTPVAPVETPQRRQPEIESDLGFDGRRPLKDPFRVGERIVHSVNYFKVQAGTLVLETRPFAEVNGKKNYQFRTKIQTSSLFESFYAVDDYVDVLMDFDQLIPSVFTLHVKESSQLKEAQMLFDHQKNIATFWEKKVTEKNGEESKKQQWEINPFSQNVFSAAFYMRVFQWDVGKENSFYVADDEKNLIFRGKAVRRERISTAAGDFNAIVIRPEIELKGKFNPVGDNYIWLSDDDRKYILRIESKIKIGTLVSEAIEIHPGR